jgi:hypothetical protein
MKPEVHQSVAEALITFDQLIYKDHDSIKHVADQWLKGSVSILSKAYPDSAVQEMCASAHEYFAQHPRNLFGIYNADPLSSTLYLAGVSPIDRNSHLVEFYLQRTRGTSGGFMRLVGESKKNPEQIVTLGLCLFNSSDYNELFDALRNQDGSQGVMKFEKKNGKQMFSFKYETGASATYEKYGQIAVEEREKRRFFDVYATHFYSSPRQNKDVQQELMVQDLNSSQPVLSIHSEV